MTQPAHSMSDPPYLAERLRARDAEWSRAAPGGDVDLVLILLD